MKKVIILIFTGSLFFCGCAADENLMQENEKLRSQNRELRQMLHQYRKDTNRKQIQNLSK